MRLVLTRCPAGDRFRSRLPLEILQSFDKDPSKGRWNRAGHHPLELTFGFLTHAVAD